MMNKANTITDPDSAADLQGLFDRSLAVLCESKAISPRQIPIHISAAELQKRALTDAAKALTMLWKISEPRRVKS